MPSKCPKNKIKRKAYTTKKGTHVKATCTKNMGAPGKTPKSKKVLPKLKKGELTTYGYHLKNSAEKREKSLRKAMKHEGNLEVLRRIVVLRTYLKSNPTHYKKLNKDVEYIQEVRAKDKLKGGAKRKTTKKTKKTKKTTNTAVKKRKTTKKMTNPAVKKRKTTKKSTKPVIKRKSALKKRRAYRIKRKIKKVSFRL